VVSSGRAVIRLINFLFLKRTRFGFVAESGANAGLPDGLS
jgi:hypothetical protein